jgi:uncharacterized coiled-coil protein SlyX
MARRADNGAPTPASNRARILALEERLARMEKTIDENQHDLAIQLQRIGQVQADLDAVRAAWTKLISTLWELDEIARLAA